MTLPPGSVRDMWRALTDEAVPDDALIERMCALPSLPALRRLIMQMPAFQLQLPREAAKVPLTAPALSVETAADPETLDALLARVRGKWRQLGIEKAHWSVTGKDEFLPDNLPESRTAFEASGQSDVDMILAVLARNGLGAEEFGRVCDFGCGVGRVSLPLAERFPFVQACDISEVHLRHARDAAVRRGIRNIGFALVERPEFGMLEPFDLWFSNLVLQHNPPPIMAAILRRMLAMLAPNGVAMFQAPTYIRGYSFSSADYLRAPTADLLEVHALPQQAVLAILRDANCDLLEIREDCAVWPPSEAVSNTIVARKRPIPIAAPKI